MSRKVTTSTSARTFSAGELIHGAWYALEQCGLLLNDAALLLDRDRPTTAAGVAMLAREELGRHRMLLDLWREAHRGGTVVLAEVKRLLERQPHVHLVKQRRGGGSVALRADRDSDMGRLLDSQFRAPVGSAEFKTIREQIQAVVDERRDRQPGERHDLRLKAFYVGVGENGAWVRPSLLDSLECAYQVQDAINDYRIDRDHVVCSEVYGDDALTAAWSRLPFSKSLPVPPFISERAVRLDRQVPNGKKGAH